MCFVFQFSNNSWHFGSLQVLKRLLSPLVFFIAIVLGHLRLPGLHYDFKGDLTVLSNQGAEPSIN